MNSKLEEKLMQYEKNTPIKNKQELLYAVESILKEEESKKSSKRDIDLIDEAVDIILTLNGIDAENLEHDANVLTDKILNEANKRVTFGTTKSKKASIKWLAPIAAIISLFLSINVIAYAMGYDLISMTNDAFKQLKEKIWYSNNDSSIIKTSDNRVYKDVKEMIENESFENLLWPAQMDELKFVGDIEVIDYDNELEIICRFDRFGNAIEYNVIFPAEYNMDNLDLIKIGEYEVNVSNHENKYQANLIYKGNGYLITAQDNENLEYFIKNLKETK